MKLKLTGLHIFNKENDTITNILSYIVLIYGATLGTQLSCKVWGYLYNELTTVTTNVSRII